MSERNTIISRIQIDIYEFHCIVCLTAILRLLQRQTPFFFNLQFLLLLS